MPDTLFKVCNLKSWYEVQKNILDGCNFIINRNEIVALVGSNGSGKTTLIKTIMDIHHNFKVDEVEFLGKDSDFKDINFKKNRLAVFSDDTAFRYWSFWEYTEFLHKTYGKTMDRNYLEHLLEGFNFNKYEDYVLKDLSMGNRKKFYIISALGLRLPLLVLDEPVDGLDFESTVFLYEELRKYKEYGSIFMSTHILESINEVADSYVLLHNGKVSDKNRITSKLSSDEIIKSFEV
ncbi:MULTISPECIES: ATP-binding cassette domain-containing protein [Anaerococcus]|uniref:ABC transporter ATP-binding protein n=1 Tax=Anaerococcus nagyae TaxID=1755241 RepID=A0A3E2TKQ4_9FIRM|nr:MULTISPECIES: ATP-binding cassette domain-containing protein [Anaerococcus]MDU2566097.1 ATP-binding cassette domain-containing protein [Anaerococcus sp.]RGB77923.1 ABC transporter ATP-binding protein [Anaerococcus nagyae]